MTVNSHIRSDCTSMCKFCHFLKLGCYWEHGVSRNGSAISQLWHQSVCWLQSEHPMVSPSWVWPSRGFVCTHRGSVWPTASSGQLVSAKGEDWTCGSLRTETLLLLVSKFLFHYMTRTLDCMHACGYYVYCTCTCSCYFLHVVVTSRKRTLFLSILYHFSDFTM